VALKYKRTAAIVGIAGALIIGPLGGMAMASDNSGNHICLTSASGSCVDLENDSFTNQNPVWVFGSNGSGLGWNMDKIKDVCEGGSCGSPWPFASGSGLNTHYSGRPVYEILKTQGSSGTNGYLVGLRTEQAHFGEPQWESGSNGDYGLWVYSSDNYLVNVGLSDDCGSPEFMNALGTTDESLIFVDASSACGSNPGSWQRWSW
jgi:hypothetical protein